MSNLEGGTELRVLFDLFVQCAHSAHDVVAECVGEPSLAHPVVEGSMAVAWLQLEERKPTSKGIVHEGQRTVSDIHCSDHVEVVRHEYSFVDGAPVERDNTVG